MRRAHRRWHLILWVILTPLIAAALILAISLRPGAPVNDALPKTLTGKSG